MTKISLKELFHKNLHYRKLLNGVTVIETDVPCEIPVRIPKIQRDYAEGRETDNVKRKRRYLLTDIIRVLYGQRKELSFDFVYGYMVENGHVCTLNDYNDYEKNPGVVFDPLDGQQRVTTLFLFYWFYGRANALIDKDGKHSLFIYETRPTSEEFCNWLVTKDAKSIIDSWRKVVNDTICSNQKNKNKWETEKDDDGKIDPMLNRLRYPEKKVPNLMGYITTLEDFKWDWRDDPNICSMIVVIESIYNLMTEMGLSYEDGVNNSGNLDNITFQLLDDLECDGDELFEKMNARGKALTHFEEIKSTLEEEMEIQGLPSTNPSLVTDWQDKIDKKWADYCWNTVITTSAPSLDDVRKVEEKLERLVLRMIAKSFFNVDIKHTKPTTKDALDYGAILEDSVTNDMDKVVDNYVDYAQHERSLKTPNGLSTIVFADVLADIDNMLYNDNGKWNDVFQLVRSNGFCFYSDNTRTLLDDFLWSKTTHNVRVMFYAMMTYLKECPASTIASNSVELDNFTEWMRFIRNVYLPENKTAGLNNVEDANKAIDAINHWLKEYFDPSSTYSDVLAFIRDFVRRNSCGQEQVRLDEEAIKANLRLGMPAKWNGSIIAAEEHPYLWGQIIAPLSWSETSTGIYDYAVFEQYMERLSSFSWNDLGLISVKLVQALLCVRDYRTTTNTSGLGSLRRFVYHRDFSWKRYLRDDNGSGKYGELFQLLIDEWIKTYPRDDFESFLDKFIISHKSAVTQTDWRYFVINASPQRLFEFWRDIVKTNSRYVYISSDDDHVYYFRSETMRTAIRYELVTSYLYVKLGNAKMDHLNGNYGAYVEFACGAGTIRISSVFGGLYDISRNGTTYVTGANIPTLESELIKLHVITSL